MAFYYHACSGDHHNEISAGTPCRTSDTRNGTARCESVCGAYIRIWFLKPWSRDGIGTALLDI